jgi:hypothetical protein
VKVRSKIRAVQERAAVARSSIVAARERLLAARDRASAAAGRVRQVSPPPKPTHSMKAAGQEKKGLASFLEGDSVQHGAKDGTGDNDGKEKHGLASLAERSSDSNTTNNNVNLVKNLAEEKQELASILECKIDGSATDVAVGDASKQRQDLESPVDDDEDDKTDKNDQGKSIHTRV